jgi:hypothetical protein
MDGPMMARPGSTVSRGRALAVHDLAQALGQILDLGRVVLIGVGDAEPATQVELGDLDAVRVADPDGQLDHPVGRHLEAGRVEDLRADVRVQPGELQARAGDDPCHGLVGRARGQREAELLIVMRGGHELVGVGFHPGGDAYQHLRPGGRNPRVPRPGQVGQASDLLEGVGHDVPDAHVDGAGQLIQRLVVAVQRDLLRRHARR